MKKFLKKNRDGTILFKSKQDLDLYIRDRVQKEKIKLAPEMFKIFSLLAIETLHLKFGFGDVRLQKFLEDVENNIDSLAGDWFTIKELEEEYKHLISNTGGENEIWRSDERIRKNILWKK